MPFVWPAFTIDRSDEEASGHQQIRVRVRLHNDGPGMAQDVRWSIYSPHTNPRPYLPKRWHRDTKAEAEAREHASPSVRAMQGTESVPPEDGEWTGPIATWALADDPWWIVVHYSDSAGQRWEFAEPGDQRQLAGRPRRIRRPDW
jgi:hypothetical protein